MKLINILVIKMKYYIISYSGSMKGESGEPCNSNYTFEDACDVCGTGATLVGNLRVKGLSNVRNHFFETFSYDYLISKELFDFLLNRKLKVENCLNAIDTKGKPTNYFHFTSRFFLPKKSDKSTGIVTNRQCPVCLRNGYFNEAIAEESENGKKLIGLPLKLVYENIDKGLLESSDIFVTWECFGWSNLVAEGFKAVRYARPFVVVSENIKSAFEDFKVKNVHFEEIYFIS
jgi:hypothetical protein